MTFYGNRPPPAPGMAGRAPTDPPPDPGGPTPEGVPIQMLFVQDRQDDAERLVQELERCGLTTRRRWVDTEDDFRRALWDAPDVILADHPARGLDAPRALTILKETTLPGVLLVAAGSIDEEREAELLRCGAFGCVRKDRPERLVHAIGRALEHVELVRGKRRAEARLTAREFQLEGLAALGQAAMAGVQGAALADHAVHVLIRGLRVDWAELLEPGAEASTLERVAGVGEQAPVPGRVAAPEGTLSSRALASGEVCQLGEGDSPQATLHAPLPELGIQNAIAIPIGDAARPHGLLVAGTRRLRRFDREDSRFAVAVANVLDASARNRSAVTALRESETRFRQIAEAHGKLAAVVEAAPDMVSIASRDLTIQYLNRAGRLLLGIGESEDLSSIPLRGLHTEEDWRRLESEVLPALARDGVWQGEATLRTRGGQEIPMWQAIIGHRDADGKVVMVSTIGRDLRERQSLEQQLQQFQKMEAMGSLAGGVAHDFNNALMVILGNMELLADTLPASDPGRETLARAQKAGQHATGLTQQLLAFSRKQVLRPRPLDLNGAAVEMGRLLPRVLGEDISLVLELSPGVHRVIADPTQISQVIMNLAVNSRDAMSHGGRLTISTRVLRVDAPSPGSGGPAGGEYMVLAVADTGCGMTPDVRSRIFEPFFTTKGRDRGTGLGLATVHGIVKQTGGHIDVETAVGRGTTFCVYLPCTPDEAVASAPRIKRPARGGDETVLVVEDQEDVRTLICQILSRKGYRVLEASGEAEALAACEREPGPVHAALVDVVLADGSGTDIARRLAESRPEMKVVFMSGHTNDAMVRHGLHAARVTLLVKPFSIEKLLETVREALDSTRT